MVSSMNMRFNVDWMCQNQTELKIKELCRNSQILFDFSVVDVDIFCGVPLQIGMPENGSMDKFQIFRIRTRFNSTYFLQLQYSQKMVE